MISTRGRYALAVMLDLAKNDKGAYIPMKDVAARQGISLKYLEQIIPVLSKNKMVLAAHGKGGGYRLAKDASEYRLGDILRLVEKDLAPVTCLSRDAGECPKASQCGTLPFWKGLEKTINDYIDGFVLSDLL